MAQTAVSFRPRLTRYIHTRKIIARRNLKIWKRLVIKQVGIIGGLNVFYQPGLLQHRINFRFGLDEIHRHDLIEHLDNLRPARLHYIACRLKIARHP